MKRRWKKSAALCLAALLAGLAPAGTMHAAEESVSLQPQEDVNDGVAKNASETQETADEAVEEEASAAQETADEAVEEEASAAQETADEAVEEEASAAQETADEAVEEEASAAQETADEAVEEETLAVQDITNDTSSAGAVTESVQIQQQDNDAAESGLVPAVDVKLPGNVQTHPIGGQIAYTYIGNHDQRIYISVEQGIALYYYFESMTEQQAESRNEEELASLWQGGFQNGYQEIALNRDGRFILYLKADAGDGHFVSLRTDGIIVDAAAPVIVGIDNGGSYPEGTKFWVNDENLADVKINEQVVEPDADGAYLLAADAMSQDNLRSRFSCNVANLDKGGRTEGSSQDNLRSRFSCVIRATDQAGNETVYNVSVEKKDSDQDPGEEVGIIDMDGTYSLRTGKAYRLGSGRWTVTGDSTVYRGGSTFFVGADGDYSFQRKK